ncbi:D-sedoheptulose 7-phosphate isomerase [Aquicella lusitana]|uniref:Phosphoheptose isomerase n=1 Tax=Aquicella lusitana TaxID=254246 RepID=A0A370GN44_9COXI|nr:D-sedoheptulose 7-phosphate isomerase [Aquicella lusitana]RDI45138.1 phosphoheptose isomerase [Aquicella lusitana]VVC72792.1 Phosphoheptose isomerase [Aquicella lusitana]
MHHLIQDEIQKLSSILIKIQQDAVLLKKIETIADVCIEAFQRGKKVLFAGNGGSAADAQHLAAELVVRLRYHRPGLAAIALTTDTSALTAISNDYAFENVFSRQVESLGQAGDILVGISTSGKSPNILRALEIARTREMITIGFTGKQAPMMDECCDHVLNVPSDETPKIQECHIMVGHIVCAIIEDKLFGAQYDPLQQTAKVS